MSWMVFEVMFCVVLLAGRSSCATNETVHGALTPIKQVSEHISVTGLKILNATYRSMPILNQTLPQLPSGVANTSLGAHAKATVDALSVRSTSLSSYHEETSRRVSVYAVFSDRTNPKMDDVS